MTIYYLSSVDGSDASDGLSWDNAYATFKYAVETASAAASGPHLLYVDSAHSESLSADTTITAAGNIRILCVNRSTGALATTALIGAQATNYNVTLAGGYNVYFYGIGLKNGSNTNANKNIVLSSTDGAQFEFENCTFSIYGASGSRLRLIFIASNATNSYVRMKSCTIFLNNAGHMIDFGIGIVVMENCTLDPAGASPTYLFSTLYAGSMLFAEGCDFSDVGSGTLIKNVGAGGWAKFWFTNCKIGTGTVFEAASTVVNLGQTEAFCYNCDDGDEHFRLAHYNPLGETTVSTSIYANDGASYDGSNRCSWKIVTTANCSYYTPYVSPWMDAYHSGTSEISPYLEILRSGSTTKYQNDEVWGEFSYQGTSGSTKATIVSDRMTPLGTAADQTASSLDASGWTGEDATNNAFMKLEAGAITPAEIGHIRARVCVGEPSITVYVDPKIRPLS